MGYYTKYQLEVDDEQPLQDDASWKMVYPQVEELLFRDHVNAIKWYDHKADMIQMSDCFPSVRFTLSGVGEEITMGDCDVWIKTFKGGKMIRHQKGEITFKDVIL